MISVLQTLLFVFMVVLMLFMLLIILLQRGKGGGLVGAFGGMGGNSAFGAKSSDVFMRITIWTAIIWFVLCIAGGYLFKATRKGNLLAPEAPIAAPAAPAESAPVAE
ncbi:MAG: preprotein translocase subunit SecG, partial [Thermoguttaceae bacterium]|nr:preprotein translocase subunit SecG [Thermoguttaceae bacterium]